MPNRTRHPIPIAIYLATTVIALVFALIGAFDRHRTGLYLGTSGLTLLLTYAAYLAVPMLDRPGRRVTGTVALTTMILIWAGLVVLIWNAFFDWFDEESAVRLGGCLIIGTVSMLPIVGALAQIGRPRFRIAGLVQLVGFGGTGILAIVAVWAPSLHDVAVALILTGIVATILIAAMQPRTRLPWWIRQSVAAVGLASSLVLLRLLAQTDDPGSWWAWSPDFNTIGWLGDGVLFGFAITSAAAILNLLLLPRISRGGWLRWATFATCVITIGLFTVALHGIGTLLWTGGGPRLSTDVAVLMRIGLASGIISLVLALAFFSMVRGSLTEGDLVQTVTLALTCPRCTLTITLDQGDQICPHCGLGFQISFERPTCRACHHTLNLASGTICSECGTDVMIRPA